MYQLTSVPNSCGGLQTEWGFFSTVRDATEAARIIELVAPVPGRVFDAKDVDTGGWNRLLLTPPKYSPDVEIALSDGRIVWVGDVDEALRQLFDLQERHPAAVEKTLKFTRV